MIPKGKKLEQGLGQVENTMKIKAENILRKKSLSSTDELEGLSPEEIRQKLHDLKVYQVELELQNEELRVAEEKLEAARARYFDLYDLAPVGYCTVSEKGVIGEANLTLATLLAVPRSSLAGEFFNRFIFARDQDIYYLKHKQLVRTGITQTFELRMVKTGGDILWAQLTVATAQGEDGRPVFRIALSDSPERKLLETYKDLSREILLVLCHSEDVRNALQSILTVLKEKIGVGAVGIRLQEGDAFPCFVQDGFPDDFLSKECSLVQHIVDGNVDRNLRRDQKGAVRLACTCGLVLSGKDDPISPNFTKAGSCWLNDFCCPLDIQPRQVFRLHSGKRCIHQGYASMALVPIRSKDQIVGLIQLNDQRHERFSLNTVELLEVVASHIGAALMHKQQEKMLKENKERLQLALDIAEIGICDWDLKNKRCLSSPSYYAMLGYTPLPGPEDQSQWLARIHPEDEYELLDKMSKVIRGEDKVYQYTVRMNHADGSYRWHSVTGNIVEWDHENKPLRLISARMDITQQRETERLLQNYTHHLVTAIENERAQIARDLHDGIGQDLTALSFYMKKMQNKVSIACSKPEQIERDFNIIFDDIKNISVSINHICKNLKPMLLDDLGLLSAIEWLAGELSSKSGVQLDTAFSCNLCKFRDQSTHIFRIVQEALNNSLKHAKATSISIACNRLTFGCVFEVSDNGCGYNHGKPSNDLTFGRRGMHERADMLGGRIEWKNRVGGGTTVSLYLPEQCQTERGLSCDI